MSAVTVTTSTSWPPSSWQDSERVFDQASAHSAALFWFEYRDVRDLVGPPSWASDQLQVADDRALAVAGDEHATESE